MKQLGLTLKPVLAALVLGACSTNPAMPDKAWKVSPVQSVRHGGSNAEGYYALGRVKENQGAGAQAISAYRKAVEADTGHAAAWNALGALLVQQGNFDEGMPALERAVSLSPLTSHLHNNLGYAQLLSGRDEAAAASLRRAVELDADNRRAWANLATAYRRIGANERAEFAEARASGTWAAMQRQAAAQAAAASAVAQPAPVAQPVIISPAAAAPASSPVVSPNATAAPTVAAVPAIAAAPAAALPVTHAAPVAVVETAPRTTLVKVAENVFELHNTPLPRSAAVAEAAAIIAAVTTPTAVTASALEPLRPAPRPVPTTAVAAPSANTAAMRTVRYEITNGHGGEGLARRLATLLGQQGIARPRLTNFLPYNQAETFVEYRDGYRAEAEAFAAQLPFRPEVQPAAGKLIVDVRLMLGRDLTTSDACAVLGVCTRIAGMESTRSKAQPSRLAVGVVRVAAKD